MRIQHNIMAMNAYRNYTNNVSAMKKNLEKLSSGYKINRAGDDAAGLAISEKMRAQITGLETAQKNAKDGISLVQTAEGALTEVHDMLNRMVELATQSANGTYDNTTDRYQLQKEVDQLLSEINRIADSSNFNGIKLLNGTLGLNTDAFEISSAAAVAGSNGKIEGSELISGGVHLEVTGNATQTEPEAKIDLGDLAVKGVAKATDATHPGTATISITVGDTKYDLTLTNTSTTAEKDFTATEIAGLLKTAMMTGTNGVDKTTGVVHTSGAANNDAIRLGDAIYEVKDNNDGTLSLEFTGHMEGGASEGVGGTFKELDATNNPFTEEQAAKFNAKLGFTVSSSAVAGGVKEGEVIHDAKDVAYAVAKTPSTLAGADITLTADMIKNGNTLTIDGRTFTFKTDATDNSLSGADVIDVSDLSDPTEQLHKAVDLLSHMTIDNAVTSDNKRGWTISSKNANTIHIDQTTGSATGKALLTQADIEKLISFQGQSTTAANAGTKISVTAGALKDGNTLNIDGEKFSFSGDFTDADSLAAAINGNSTLSAKYTATVDGNDVYIRANAADGTGPVVLGKGLTLQIGDTADDYNQLNVAVQDMHASSLGIDGLKIDSEEAAQKAIDKIKAAINKVSDVRGTLGATQNRLDHTINNLSVMTENIQDAESTIRDTDVAAEMMAYTKNNILIQSAQAMLAQANQIPQGVLQLLQ